MKKKKIVIIILFGILGLILLGIGGVIIHNKEEQAKGPIIYRVKYYDDYIPGSESEINVYENSVEIIKIYHCSSIECIEDSSNSPKPEKKTYHYSQENMDKLKKLMADNNFVFEEGGIAEIHRGDTKYTEYQKNAIESILFGEYFFEINVETYKYKMEYDKNDELSYIAYFKDDNSILVKKLKYNDDYKIVKVETYSLNFSEENLKILKDYIENEVKIEDSNIIYKHATLKEYELNIIKSIVENKEGYLKDIQDLPKLMYTITYEGIKCDTPTLYLYSNNTYEYYYTYAIGNKKLIPKTGTYNYDMTKIINNIDNYEQDLSGVYIITDNNGNNYETYRTNIELQEFLKSLNVTLEKCLEAQ